MNKSDISSMALRSRSAARACHAGALAAFLLVLAACGGGEGGGDSARAQERDTSASTEQAAALSPAQVQAQLGKGAALSRTELQSAETQALAADTGASTPLDQLPPGTIAAKADYSAGNVARKALAVRIPAFRFYNTRTGAHFYTTSESERDTVVATLSPPFNLEGEAFSVASGFSPGLSPVHRFYNTRNGVHFYTISESERANVVATLPQFTYEGVAYHASQVSGAGLIPFYRFYVPSKGFHFYTASEAEKNNVQANLSATYSYEGIGYYVLSSDWRAEKLPHTGVNDAQCYRVGSNTLVTCLPASPIQVFSDESIYLNPQQDGHRRSLNALSYSAVPNPGGGSFPSTSCVKDNVTGLVWEVKETTGTRSLNNTYTNQNNNSANDASGYVTAVNAMKLCGFADWRLPTRNELLTILHLGRTAAPLVSATWFPNTSSTNPYWSANALSTDIGGNAWEVSFGVGGELSVFDSTVFNKAVRLVRGNAFSGPRYSYSSVAYGSDGNNNLVNDAWTGLQWRRCEQGRVWSGSACTGSATNFTHESALAHAKAQAGWRLPNIKELSSLSDLGVASGAARIDGTAFPGAEGSYLWASTPHVADTARAWLVDFSGGRLNDNGRGLATPARLVRINP